ncbi:MAG: nucleotidyltransferase domain-containing protein [Candidatus Thorarchaeota archaeon]
MPRWLGKAYSKLWYVHGSKAFDLSTASDVLRETRPSVRILMSRFVEHGSAIRIERGLYQLLSPSYLAAATSGAVKLGRLLSTPYDPLFRGLLSALLDKFGRHLLSVTVFGSVARGDASSESDVDVLLVVKEWEKSVMERAEDIGKIDLSLTPVRKNMWQQDGILAPIQFLTLDAEEANSPRLLYMDLVLDAVILLDRDGFMRKILERVEARMKELGSKRVVLPDRSWYWVMKEGVKMGEVFEI